MEAAELLRDAPTWVGYVIVGAPGVWALFKLLREGQKDRSKERADLIRIAQEVAEDAIATLRSEVDRLRKEVDALERELSTARREHAETVAAKDAKILLLEGELRAAAAREQALMRLLDEHGIAHAPATPPVFRVPRGDGPTPVEPI